MELKRFAKLFAIKPLLIIYALQYAIVGPVSRYRIKNLVLYVLITENYYFFSQLWLDRTCSVNLKINITICENLPQYENYENQVQQEVSRLNILGNYIETVPSIIISLLLGKKTYQVLFL